MVKKKSMLSTPELVPWLPPGKPKEETFNVNAHKKNSGVYDLTASQIGGPSGWHPTTQKPSIDSHKWSIRWNKDKNGKGKNSVSERERRISELLNASHNSDAERDYLRSRILEIFDDAERKSSTMEPIKEEDSPNTKRKDRHSRERKKGTTSKKNSKENQRRSHSQEESFRNKEGDNDPDQNTRRSLSADRDEGYHDSIVEGNGVHDDNDNSAKNNQTNSMGSNRTDSALGSDDLRTRSSIDFIDSKDQAANANMPNQYDIWERGGRQSNEMILLDDLEHNSHVYKNSVVQTMPDNHMATSTHFLHGKASQTDSYDSRLDYGSSPISFQSIQLGRASRHSQMTPPPAANAWVIFPKESDAGGRSLRNFTARPLNLAGSMGSRLKQSFAQVNRSTPVESISNQALINEDDPENQMTSEEKEKKRKRSAMMAGAAVGGGTLLLALVLVGGALIATSGSDATVSSGSIDTAGFFPGYNYNDDQSPCNNYKNLTESWRKITGIGPSTTGQPYHCDTPRPNQGQPGIEEGWHRFTGEAGTHLPTEALNTGAGSREVCGTSILAWLNGDHPTVAEGIASRQFCFEWGSGICQFAVRSQVRTCPEPDKSGRTFYVYNLKIPNDIVCQWAYCAM